MVVEIFAGTARLSRAFTKRGFRVSSVDHTTKRSTGLITILDLTKDEDLNFLLDFLKAELNVLVYIHLAPPCGTASAARGIPVPGCPKEMQPAPLRTKEFPDGLPGLAGLDSIIVQFCVLYGIVVSIENPLNSLFWLTKPMVELFALCEGFRVVFDNCMMGGQRDKATLWWCNRNIFSPLALRCSRDHQHKNWTPVFDKANKRFNFPTPKKRSTRKFYATEWQTLWIKHFSSATSSDCKTWNNKFTTKDPQQPIPF